MEGVQNPANVANVIIFASNCMTSALTPLHFTCNFSERTLELELNLVSLDRQSMSWSGITTRKLGLVEPSGSVDIALEAVPHDTGLQVLMMEQGGFNKH